MIFCVDVEHAHRVAELFQRAGIACAPISGHTPEDERRRIVDAIRTGELRVVTNCLVLTEGFDEPSIEGIIMARPTQSPLLYTQMLGRGTRTHPGKQKLIVIDFVDNTSRHSLMTLPRLFGLKERFDMQGQDVIHALAAWERPDIPCTALQKAQSFTELKILLRQIDLFALPEPDPVAARYSKFSWFFMPDGSFRLQLPQRELLVIRPNLLGYYEIWHWTEEWRMKVEFARELGDAFRIADDYALFWQPQAENLLKVDASWRREPATEKQLALLDSLGLPYMPGLTKGEAAFMLSRYFLRRTTHQEL